MPPVVKYFVVVIYYVVIQRYIVYIFPCSLAILWLQSQHLSVIHKTEIYSRSRDFRVFTVYLEQRYIEILGVSESYEDHLSRQLPLSCKEFINVIPHEGSTETCSLLSVWGKIREVLFEYRIYVVSDGFCILPNLHGMVWISHHEDENMMG